jgi:hypothetical protein
MVTVLKSNILKRGILIALGFVLLISGLTVRARANDYLIDDPLWKLLEDYYAYL